jgi:hypothetical protein
MIRKCGVLPKGSSTSVKEAFDFYRRADIEPKDPRAVEWRKARSTETRIRCVGVWDTVGALGIPGNWFSAVARSRFSFHDVKLSSWVDYAFHAIAIDERRKPFSPTLWEVQTPDPQFPQVVKQVWFAGVHSDVGGGYPETELSDLALAWMMEQAESAGLAFKPSTMPKGDALGTLHDSMELYYRIFGNGTRGIHDPTPTPISAYPAWMEELVPHVLTRYDTFKADPAKRYDPRPLADYFERTQIR